mmetsp:Transcript_8083/g.18764  ORF Transcript_8083/g.18764 Transcript_8083/m.18764 type:complete len:205 (-) Transcript_8083:1460-2074(-)
MCPSAAILSGLRSRSNTDTDLRRSGTGRGETRVFSGMEAAVLEEAAREELECLGGARISLDQGVECVPRGVKDERRPLILGVCNGVDVREPVRKRLCIVTNGGLIVSFWTSERRGLPAGRPPASEDDDALSLADEDVSSLSSSLSLSSSEPDSEDSTTTGRRFQRCPRRAAATVGVEEAVRSVGVGQAVTGADSPPNGEGDRPA